MFINMQMKKFIEEFLTANLPEHCYYHNVAHTMYVSEKALEIADHEGCTDQEKRLIETAGLWHDTGYIHTIKDHEDEGAILARKHLPDYNYTPEEIEIVCGMIMATKIPQSPKTKLEEIIADADMEYLGGKHPGPTAEQLYKELLNTTMPDLSEADWNNMQISFLQKHKYFTTYCKEHKEHKKQVYIDSLIANSK
jgi:uncharacterized protein